MSLYDPERDRVRIAGRWLRWGLPWIALPLLLGVPFFASFDAVTPCRVFRLEEDSFWQMLSRCRSVTRN